jgi:hypothetical protein
MEDAMRSALRVFALVAVLVLGSLSRLALAQPAPPPDPQQPASRGAPWFAVRAELLSFPAGMHDDQVDALGLIGQLLDRIGAGQKLKPPTAPRRDDYRPTFDTWSSDSFKTL